MNGRNLTLATVAGIEIRVNISWIFIAILLSWALAQGYFPLVHEGLQQIDYWSLAIIAVLGLFASILVHELAHSLVARAYGMEIKSITLWMLGGMAEMRDEPPGPRVEFLMAIAGPATSFVLSGLFYLISHALGAAGTLGLLGVVAGYLGKLNLILAVFNLVPAFPLDGGRVARAIVWAKTGNFVHATDVATRLGSGFGLGLIVLGVLSMLTGLGFGGLWFVILGLFIRFAADASRAQVHTKQVLEGETVATTMTANPVCVPPDIPIAHLIEHYMYRYHFEFFPVVEHGQLLGSVSLHQVKRVPPCERPSTEVRAIFLPVTRENTIDQRETAAQALAQMQSTGQSLLMVTDRQAIVGVIAIRDIMKRVSIKSTLVAAV